MASRGRYNNEWDLMQDEFNTSSYDLQYDDDNASGAVQLDHCRLYIRNVPPALSEDGLSTAFSKFGTINELYMSPDAVKRYALVRFDTPGEAKLAMAKLNKTEPLKLWITIAHQKKSVNRRDNIISQKWDNTDRGCSNGPRRNYNREDSASVSSRGKGSSSRRHDDLINGDELQDIMHPDMDAETKMKDLELELQRLQVQEQAVALRQKMLQLEAARKKNFTQATTSNRCILPDGRIVVRTSNERLRKIKSGKRNVDSRDGEGSFAAGAGDSNETEPVCTCHAKLKSSWDQPGTSDGSSTPSTCVLCSEDVSRNDRKQAKSVASKYTEVSRKSDYSRFDKTTNLSKSIASKTIDVKSEFSKTTISKKSDVTSKKLDVEPARKRKKSEITCDLKYSDFYSDSEEEADETNRLIQLRNSDYMDIVDDALKVVIALAGYPKSKMRLRQMEMFQRCLTDVIDMQLKAGLLKKVPAFLDYYLNRGSIVLICKDLDTRDWMVRVSPGLQERMCTNLILLKSKVKRLCLAVLKIPRTCWPATAQDAFKLLQYFNPTLKTDLWKIYSQKVLDDVECSSFLIDRVSGEIIRGPTFKNVIDYNQIEFELTGYTEIYYECLLADLEDLCSVASRVKLLEDMKSADATPRNDCQKPNLDATEKENETNIGEAKDYENLESDDEIVADDAENVVHDLKKNNDHALQNVQALDKIKDITYISEKDEVIVWSDEANTYCSDHEVEKEKKEEIVIEEVDMQDSNVTATSAVAVSDKTESVIESTDNLISRSSNLNIDSNRGIAYHRRTNYLHVEDELKVAITLEGYPVNKLEGTHIRRLKHLFKEYLHKDMKMQKFANLIIPKFQDIYLSNGAVIYVCDSLETKDYLTEVLPKFVNSTGLKLTFRDIKNLVRYTRLVLRLPKEYAHVESMKILLKLQSKYPGLKPDCWKYYSDVAGKQKRQFGVDPESLDVIKSPDFDPTYEGEKLSFRIIDRQKRDVSFEESSNQVEIMEDAESKMLRDKVVKIMYVPVDPEITNSPLTRIRTNHYSDLIADDLKLYVGPSKYPEIRVDEMLFHSIKRAFENIVCDFFAKGDLDDTTVPKFHDMYLFDGVIFIICQNMYSREWMEQTIGIINSTLRLDLKSTEFRGAVGIVSMIATTYKSTDEVISALQKQNPRLRTKFWRKISTVRSKNKLDVVLQIDKLSAQVITSPKFMQTIDGNPVQFKLGHLQSLLNPKSSLEELTKLHIKNLSGNKKEKKGKNAKSKEKTIEELRLDIKKKYPNLKIEQWDVISQHENDIKVCNYEMDESARIVEKNTSKAEEKFPKIDPIIIEPDSKMCPSDIMSPISNLSSRKVICKIPASLLPYCKEDLSMIFDMLEDKNPGLNTELWKVVTDSSYPGNGKFSLVVDRQSASVLQGKNFDPSIGGEKLKFFV